MCVLCDTYLLQRCLFAKSEWKELISQSVHMVKHCHANNGHFSDNGFIDAINEKYQKIIFYGVGAHHHSVIVNKK